MNLNVWDYSDMPGIHGADMRLLAALVRADPARPQESAAASTATSSRSSAFAFFINSVSIGPEGDQGLGKLEPALTRIYVGPVGRHAKMPTRAWASTRAMGARTPTRGKIQTAGDAHRPPSGSRQRVVGASSSRHTQRPSSVRAQNRHLAGVASIGSARSKYLGTAVIPCFPADLQRLVCKSMSFFLLKIPAETFTKSLGLLS